MSRKLVSYRLADDLQQALKARASREGISTTELVNRFLRQGLATDDQAPPVTTDEALKARAAKAMTTVPATAPADAADTELRLSRLEAVLHEITKRVDQVADAAATAQTAQTVQSQLLAMDQALKQLSVGVEESRAGVCQLRQAVQAVAPRLLDQSADHGSPTLPTAEAAAVVPVSLETLRQLLATESS